MRCGTSWGDANGWCGTPCPSGTDGECPAGETCFADLKACGEGPDPTPAPAASGGGSSGGGLTGGGGSGGGGNTLRCGTSWGDANSRCGTPCPSATNGECAAGETCFADLKVCDGGSGAGGSTPTTPGPSPAGTPSGTPSGTSSGLIDAKFTYYWMKFAADFDAAAARANGDDVTPTPLRTCPKYGAATLGTVPRVLAEKIRMEGSAYLAGGMMVNLADCDCGGGFDCFFKVDSARHPWGVGAWDSANARSYTLEPYVSIASNAVPLGTTLVIPDLVGKALPGASPPVHDGCVRVDDVSWSFGKEEWLDFFVALREHYVTLVKGLGATGHVGYRREACTPKTYTVALPASGSGSGSGGSGPAPITPEPTPETTTEKPCPPNAINPNSCKCGALTTTLANGCKAQSCKRCPKPTAPPATQPPTTAPLTTAPPTSAPAAKFPTATAPPATKPPTDVMVVNCMSIDSRADDSWCKANCVAMVAAFPTWCKFNDGPTKPTQPPATQPPATPAPSPKPTEPTGSPPTKPVTPMRPALPSRRCGHCFEHANARCGMACTTDADCAGSEGWQCYDGLAMDLQCDALTIPEERPCEPKLLKPTPTPKPPAGGACHAIDSRATDSWCQANCENMVKAFPTYCASNGSNTAGIAFGAGVGVLAAAGVFMFQRRRCRREQQWQQQHEQEQQEEQQRPQTPGGPLTDEGANVTAKYAYAYV